MEYGLELRKALFYNDFERTKALLESPSFSEELLIDCGDFASINVPTPIYYITQLWNEILPGDWPFCQEAVDGHKANLSKITSYLKNAFNVSADKPIDLQKYISVFAEYDDDSTVEDIMLESKEELVSKGFRNIDVDLYCAAIKFDFAETERLLALGADDSVFFEDDEELSSVYGYMGDDFLDRDVWQSNTLFPHPNYEKRKFEVEFTHYMMSSVAKERMVRLLNKYYEAKKSKP